MTPRARATPYLICLLLALIAAILPAAIFPDFVMPVEYWNNMQGPAAATQHRYSVTKLPPVLRVETVLFKILVVPPSLAAELFGRWRSDYARLVMPDRDITETAGTPHFFRAGENFALAFPFWFLVCVAVFETSRWFRARQRMRHAA